MEIVVTARHTEVPVRFRRHLDDKLAKVEQLAPKAQRLEVAVSHEANKRQSERCERIELTLHGSGAVVRAEACASDAYAALDMAATKLFERLRRASDRKKVHKVGHGGHHLRAGALEPVLDGAPLDGASFSGASSNGAAQEGAEPQPAPVPSAAEASVDDGDAHTHRGEGDGEWVLGESPVVIRDKVHPSTPMTLEVALEQMELVGHDFYLFVDSASGRPSVVYRRRGWSYGVLRLAGEGDGPEHGEAPAGASAERVRESVSAR